MTCLLACSSDHSSLNCSTEEDWLLFSRCTRCRWSTPSTLDSNYRFILSVSKAISASAPSRPARANRVLQGELFVLCQFPSSNLPNHLKTLNVASSCLMKGPLFLTGRNKDSPSLCQLICLEAFFDWWNFEKNSAACFSVRLRRWTCSLGGWQRLQSSFLSPFDRCTPSRS